MTDMRVPYGIETRVQESLRVSIRLVVRAFEIQTKESVLVRRPALIWFRLNQGRSEAEGEDSMRFPMSAYKL